MRSTVSLRGHDWRGTFHGTDMVFCGVLFRNGTVLKPPSCVTQPIPKPYQLHIDFFLMATSTLRKTLLVSSIRSITRRHHEESLGIPLDVPTTLVARFASPTLMEKLFGHTSGYQHRSSHPETSPRRLHLQILGPKLESLLRG